MLLRPTTNNDTSRPLGAFGADRGPGHSPRYHQGHDFPVSKGTPVLASGDGVVSAVENTGTSSGFGLYVKCTYGTTTIITAHLSQVDVRVGDQVRATTRLGLSGGRKGEFGAGASEGAHCHVEVNAGGNRCDPMNELSPRAGIAGLMQEEEDDMRFEEWLAGGLEVPTFDGTGNRQKISVQALLQHLAEQAISAGHAERPLYLIIQDREPTHETFGSTAVFGSLIGEGWRQLSEGLGDRSEYEAIRAIGGQIPGLGDPHLSAIHVDAAGWALARSRFGKAVPVA